VIPEILAAWPLIILTLGFVLVYAYYGWTGVVVYSVFLAVGCVVSCMLPTEEECRDQQLKDYWDQEREYRRRLSDNWHNKVRGGK